MKRLALMCALALGTLGFAVPAAAQPKPYELTALLPVTGSFALIGASMINTYHVLEKYINATGGIHGRPVHFTILDDQTNPLIDVQLVAPLIEAKVPVFFDGGGVAGCKAIDPLIAANGPVLYCLSPAYFPAPNSYGFALPSSEDGIRALFGFIRARHWSKVAIMTPINADGQNADKAFSKFFALPENRGLQTVAYEHYNAGDISVAAQLAKIRQGNPDVFLAWGSGSIVGTVYRSMKDVGFEVPVAASNASMLFQQLDQWKDILPKDDYMYSLMFPAGEVVPKGPQKDAIATMYREFGAMNLKPDLGAGNSWDPVMLVVTALRGLPENATAAQLHDAMLKIHGYAGVNGIYDFRDGNQRGLGAESFIVVRWEPASRSFQPVYPH
jgi:branched-chain amino acid transport system substrate-binding protein